ncbi:MAG TPA: zf-TFIIB domain-containing protein, partial [Myxococcota bacterium]
MPTTDDTPARLPCPACHKRGVDTALSPGGALDGHGCGRCGGLLVPPSGSERLLYDELALDRATLLEIAHSFGGKRFACPSCRSHVRALMVRGVNVDLCFHCGSLWLDHGEIERLSSDRYPSPIRTELAALDVAAVAAADATLRFDSRPPWHRFFSDAAGVAALGLGALAVNAAGAGWAIGAVVAGAAWLSSRGHDTIDIFPRARRYVRARRWLVPASPRDSDARVLDDNRAVVVRPFLGFADISLVDSVGRTLVDIAFIRRGLAVSEAAMWARRLGADVIVHP